MVGNGRGTGNPYGSAAAAALILVPLIFVRIFSPPQYMGPIVLACVSFIFPSFVKVINVIAYTRVLTYRQHSL